MYDEGIYRSPEYCMYNNLNSSCDVYSFAMIAYLLISNEKQFQEITYEIVEQVCEEKLRPKFNENVPKCYQKLIEKCWSNDPKERPTFEEIVNHLKTNPEFLTSEINIEEFQNYVKFIDGILSIKNNIQIDDFIKSKNQTFRKVKIDFNKLKNPSKLTFSVNMGSIDLTGFEKQEKIGSGSFGTVYKVLNKETEKIYAAKISIYEIDQCQDDTITNLIREIDIISQLNHPSILQFIGFNSKNFKNKPKPIIITEYAQNGSLDAILELERSSCGNHEWNDTKKLINIYGIASGMAYLHARNILHRDLKPGNILLDEFLFPKIADFGLSKFITEEDEIEINKKKPITSGFKGTYAYCAPEIIESQKYTKKGDIYAFGLILYEIITNNSPYSGLNQYQLIHKVINGYRPEFNFTIPYCYKKLIEKCWAEDEDKRPDFSQIVTILETDPKFITQNVDEEEYSNYIFSIKERQHLLFNYDNVDKEIEKIKFNKVTFDLKNIITIEDNSLNDCFIDLSKYERQSIISKGDFSKIYKFKEKETGQIYAGQISMLTIGKILGNDLSNLKTELKIISQLNHPSLLKFIGYTPIDFKKQRKPIIITELPINGKLEDVLQVERIGNSIPGWNETKKLINIYGIASGMLYLHSKEIVHRCLNPSNIYLDEFLAPKIGDFGLSTRFFNTDSITLQSISGVRGTPIYTSPEILQSNEYSKSSDVYAFSFIVYEIITKKIPFQEITNMNQIFDEVVINGNRPIIDKSIPLSYKNLIERCWSQKSDERPSFDDIVYLLKTDTGFITDEICKKDFHTFVDFIDKNISTELSQKIKEEENLDKIADNGSNKNHKNKEEKENIEFQAKKYINENDTENIYKYFILLIKKGYCKIPLEYAINLYKLKHFNQAFSYFSLISKVNHPIAKYFIAVMLFKGEGCNKNIEEAFYIMKNLSENGIDRAAEFLEEYFK